MGSSSAGTGEPAPATQTMEGRPKDGGARPLRGERSGQAGAIAGGGAVARTGANAATGPTAGMTIAGE